MLCITNNLIKHQSVYPIFHLFFSNPEHVIWDHVDQWRELPQVTDGVSEQEHVALLTFEQEKEVIDANKRDKENMEMHGVYKCMPHIGQICISTR